MLQVINNSSNHSQPATGNVHSSENVRIQEESSGANVEELLGFFHITTQQNLENLKLGCPF